MSSLVEEHHKKKKRVLPTTSSEDSKNNISYEIIIYEILPWLPLESLFECKLVCKDWRKAILTDPILRASQCQRSVTHCSGLIYRCSLLCDEYVFLDPSLKCSKIVSVTNLTSSSNGLLCGTCKKSTRGYDCFYVMNPVIEQVVFVPNFKCFKDVAFAFEPLNCNPYFAIVSPYDVTAEYHSGKVLTTTGFHVYTSQTGRWREANTKVRVFDREFRAINSISEARTVYVGGKVYWKIWRYVLWFHIKDDSGGTIDVPDSEEEWVYGEIGDCNGELTYCKVCSENVIIWVLMSCEKSEFKWVQKYSISFNEIFKDYYRNFPSCCDDAVSEILDITGRRKSRRNKRIFTALVRTMPFQGGDLQFWVLYNLPTKEGVVFSYNMKTRTLQIAHNSQIRGYGHSFFSYKRSLASVPKLCVLDHADYQ